jgi:hypothetical protein
MTEQELVQLLKRVKDAPEFGGDPSGERAANGWRRICVSIGIDPNKDYAFRWTPNVWLDFYAWKFSQLAIQPAAVAVASVLLALGGWTTTVNASHSLPGDTLYPVKLAGERMRLRFAATPVERATLQVEYAGRRVHELTEITSSDARDQDKADRAKEAVAQFTRQIATVNEGLDAIREADPEAAANIAAIVDEKTAEYETALGQSEPDVSSTVQEEVDSAIKTAEDAGEQAREALVESHETTGETATADSLKKSFQKEYVSLHTRIAFSLGRLSVIEGILGERGGGTPEQRAQIDDARNAVSFHDKQIRDAMDFLAQGGYRRAFDLLKDVGERVAISEQIITGLEIAMTSDLGVLPPEAGP